MLNLFLIAVVSNALAEFFLAASSLAANCLSVLLSFVPPAPFAFPTKSVDDADVLLSESASSSSPLSAFKSALPALPCFLW